MAFYLPCIGRLHVHQYVALFGSLILLFLEGLIRVIALALPSPVLYVFYKLSRRAFNLLSTPQSRESRNKNRALVNAIARASDFVELCNLFGYYAEEHVVQTTDGYLLGLHRLGWKHGEEGARVNHGPGSVQKKVAYLHHGLLMNSEVWVCITEQERCLPFRLVERGYDVWLGNNRGNKYSKKSLRRGPGDTKFWDFSMDQFAFHDIPDSINYILSTTSQPPLSYIGFSQGTAQAFAALSIHPTLNDKINVFVAMAPAMSPAGLTTGIVDSFLKASPDLLFLAFGRRAILTSITAWQALIYPPIFVRAIDWAMTFLFDWRIRNISPHQKLASYPHLYSFSSTKSVVHWFQIIRTGTFQMYDDEVQSPFALTNGTQHYKVAKYPTRNIKTPIVLVYGGSDSLVSIDVMLKELPTHTVVKAIPHYEHLDFLWASDVHEQVFPYVFDALDAVHDPDNADAGTRLVSAAIRRRSSSQASKSTPPDSDDDSSASSGALHKLSENVPPGGGADTASDAASLRSITNTAPASAASFGTRGIVLPKANAVGGLSSDVGEASRAGGADAGRKKRIKKRD